MIARLMPEYMYFAKDKGAKIQKWGVMGHCWGGKVAALLTGAGDATWHGTFQAAAQCHPSLVNVDDASKINVPMMVLASKGEDKDAMNQYRDRLNNGGSVDIFNDQEHGWMASK
jgi:dienelactone hydrolase